MSESDPGPATGLARPFGLMSPEEVEQAWKVKLSPWMLERIQRKPFAASVLSEQDRDNAILKVLRVLDGELTRSGAHRLSAWERGWQENLDAFIRTKDLRQLAPRYFGKEPIIRWRQQYWLSEDPLLEYQMFGTVMDWVADDWMSNPLHVYEFGCGTGHNLLRIRERYPETYLTGLDWAASSQGLITRVAQATGDPRLTGARFDYFHPDMEYTLKPGSTVVTVASLEQTGTNFRTFLDYLISQKVDRVIHVEPMWEFLDPHNLLDFLSIQYFRARGYLDGLMEYLREKEVEGTVEIMRAQRSFVGSFYVDGYSIVMWRAA